MQPFLRKVSNSFQGKNQEFRQKCRNLLLLNTRAWFRFGLGWLFQSILKRLFFDDVKIGVLGKRNIL